MSVYSYVDCSPLWHGWEAGGLLDFLDLSKATSCGWYSNLLTAYVYTQLPQFKNVPVQSLCIREFLVEHHCKELLHLQKLRTLSNTSITVFQINLGVYQSSDRHTQRDIRVYIYIYIYIYKYIYISIFTLALRLAVKLGLPKDPMKSISGTDQKAPLFGERKDTRWFLIHSHFRIGHVYLI